MRLKCSFCGRDQHQVKTLFKGLTNKETLGSVYICDECVVTCNDRLKRDELSLDDALAEIADALRTYRVKP